MIHVFENPPLTSYYLALAATLFGWGERALHLSLLLPALAAVWGIYSLARNYCRRPFLAALAAVITPVFLVSATTLMCDVPLLAFWVWSLVLFERGLKDNGWISPLAAGLLAGLAVMTKFTGLALIPLMLAGGLLRQRRPGRWLIAPLVPVLFAIGYEWVTRRIYGEGLLLTAFKYSAAYHKVAPHHFLNDLATGLSFTGGCLLPLLFLHPAWPRRRILAALCVVVPGAILALFTGPFEHLRQLSDQPAHWESFAEGAIFVAVGIGVLLFAAADLIESRDSVSLLLVLWMAGIFVFATLLNWTINGRSLLPMVPAFGILLARRLDRNCAFTRPRRSGLVFWPILPSMLISLLVVKADCDLAGAGRAAATELCARCRNMDAPPATIWFQGHWGFQYYMEKLGARHIEPDFGDHGLGRTLVQPAPYANNNIQNVPAELVRLVEAREYLGGAHLETMNCPLGAGFYASIYGPLPFVAAESIPPQRYYIFKFVRPLTDETDLRPEAGAMALQDKLETEAARDRALLAADPGNLEAQFRLGVFLVSRAQTAEAAKHFNAILQVHPDDGPAHLQLALLTDDLRHPADAVAHYRAALRAMPDSTDALIGLARLLATHPDAQQRDGAEAVRLAIRADQLSEQSSAICAGILAEAYAEAQRFPEAIAAANRAIALAEASGDDDLAAANRKRLALYQSGRAYHRNAL